MPSIQGSDDRGALAMVGQTKGAKSTSEEALLAPR